jgi:hypothetical protein
LDKKTPTRAEAPGAKLTSGANKSCALIPPDFTANPNSVKGRMRKH